MDGNHPRQLRAVPPSHHQTNNDDELKAASKEADEAVDYKQFMPKLKVEHKFLRRLIKTMVFIVIAVGLGYGAYYAGSHYNNTTTKAVTTKTAPSTATVTPPSQSYTSSNQDLSFSYPNNWKVNETSDVITATSPAIRLTSYNRQAVTGQVVFRIRAQDVALNEFSAGAATAALNSQIINYASPAADQRGSTYISFLNYANSKGSGIDGVYITGNTGYQTGQNAPESDIQAVDPVVSITFSKCSNKTCSGTTTPLTISTGSWSNKNFSGPLAAMLESLSIS
jgi:hypothetical protein